MEKNESVLANFSKQDGLDDLLAMLADWNGYEREKAVRRLGMLGNPTAIPQLIVQANDWVYQVRIAAKDALKKLLTPENAQAFVLSLPDLYHLQNCGRDDHKELITHVTHFLLKQENVIYIKSAIKNTNPYIARIAVKLCIEHSLMAKQELVFNTLSHHDIIIRAMASNLLRDFSGQVLESFLQIAIKDTFTPIRREAFQLYLNYMPEKGLEIAHKFLFDKQASIRELAIKRLLKQSVNVEQILSNILLSDNQSVLKQRCAILGLAYISSNQSIPIIIGFANHAFPSVRKACLQALTKLLDKDANSYLLTGLKDPSASVAKESLVLLNNLGIVLSIDSLLAIFETTHYSHTLTLCISGANRMNKWDKLIFLFYLFKVPKETGELQRLNNELSKWDVDFNGSYSQPSVTQIKKIKVEYSECKHLLSKHRQELLEFTIMTHSI